MLGIWVGLLTVASTRPVLYNVWGEAATDTMMSVRLRSSATADIESARLTFHLLVNSLPDSALNKRSANPGWTNGQIIWHIVFAFILTPILIVILRFFGRLPRRWSKLFASALNYSTPVFNLVNAIGPRIAVKIFPRKLIVKLFDHIID